jgi:hypothetical protein
MTKARDIASAAPAPSTVSATELGYVDGVTSAIQTQLDAKTAKSTLTTTGDIYYASAANTPARLGIGTASQLLAVNSGATAPEWVAAPSAGANWSLLNAGGTALTAASTITVSGISGKDKLMILIQGASNTTTDSSEFSIRFNTDSGSNYTKFGGTRTWTGSLEWQVPDQGTTTQIRLSNNGNVAQSTTGYVLLTGGNSSGVKQFQYFGLPDWQGYNVGRSNQGVGFYDSASTISSVSIVSSAGNFDGGTIYVYTSA